MDVRRSFRGFTERVARTVDRLSDLYGIPNLGYDAVTLDPSLHGTGIGGYFGSTPDGLSILAVSPDQTLNREVADHEASHSLLAPFLRGIYARFKGFTASISRALDEADVVRNMVDVHGYNLSDLEGYSPIKDGLYRLGRKVADAAGGAKRLYDLARERGSGGLIDLINSRPDVARAFEDFYNSYDPRTLQRYGMSEPALARARVDGYENL